MYVREARERNNFFYNRFFLNDKCMKKNVQLYIYIYIYERKRDGVG